MYKVSVCLLLVRQPSPGYGGFH